MLPRSTPEMQGIKSSAILQFIERGEHTIDDLHSVMLLRHGRVITEGWWAPYAEQTPHELYSLSKSFASTAIGIAIAEGRLGLAQNSQPGAAGQDEVSHRRSGMAQVDEPAFLRSPRSRF